MKTLQSNVNEWGNISQSYTLWDFECTINESQITILTKKDASTNILSSIVKRASHSWHNITIWEIRNIIKAPIFNDLAMNLLKKKKLGGANAIINDEGTWTDWLKWQIIKLPSTTPNFAQAKELLKHFFEQKSYAEIYKKATTITNKTKWALSPTLLGSHSLEAANESIWEQYMHIVYAILEYTVSKDDKWFIINLENIIWLIKSQFRMNWGDDASSIVELHNPTKRIKKDLDDIINHFIRWAKRFWHLSIDKKKLRVDSIYAPYNLESKSDIIGTLYYVSEYLAREIYEISFFSLTNKEKQTVKDTLQSRRKRIKTDNKKHSATLSWKDQIIYSKSSP